MKRLLIIIAAIALLAGCQTCPKCPPENAIIFVEPGFPVNIEKGHFDNTENWATEDEFNEWLEKQGQTGV